MRRSTLTALAGIASLAAMALAPVVGQTLLPEGTAPDGKALAVAAGDDLQTALSRAAEPGAECVVGFAGPFACDNVDLVDVVPTALFGGGHGSDSWGWTAPDGTEIAIVTSGNGIGFFRLAEDDTTEYLGTLALSAIQPTGILWHDVKVVNDHAYITAEDSGYGIQIVDLTKLVDLPARTPDGVTQDIEIDGFVDGVQGHNMVGFPERGLIGVVLGEEEVCGGHLVFYDAAANPVDPPKVGCVGPTDNPGVVDTPHDAHCVVYAGPDPDYNGAGADGELGTDDDVPARDVCALLNQSGGVVLMDATSVTRDRVGAPEARGTFINRFDYDTRNYTHQGWFTDDHRWLLFNDELDESGAAAVALGGNGNNQNLNTTTYWIDLQDLDVKGQGFPALAGYNAEKVKKWSNPSTIAIDHNMYPVGNLLYQANYGAGLRVLEFSTESLEGPEQEAFTEVAYYDTYPGPGPSEFYGAWNVYPFFESGKIILSDFQSGMLVLRLQEGVGEQP